MNSKLLPSWVLPPVALRSDVPAVGQQAAAVSLDEMRLPRIRLPHAGRCPGVPTLVIKIFDNSGSVTGGNDPVGNRFLEARLALDHVGRRCRCANELVAVLHFDRDTGGDGGPARLNRAGRSEIERALSLPSGGWGTSSMRPSLDDAYALAAAHPRHRLVLVGYTDFELFDDDVPQVLRDFANFPGAVHAVVLRADVPQEFVDDERVTVTRVDFDSEPGAVALATFGALACQRRSVPATPPSMKGAS